MKKAQTSPSFWRILALLTGLAVLPPLAIDIFLPAMPDAARALGVPTGDIQITMAALMAGMALGQLIYGPLGDRFGRRRVLLVAIALFSLAGFATALTTDLYWLYVWRFGHGFTVAAAQILVRAIVRDLYDGPAAARMLAYTFATHALMPIAAPIAGGYLTVLYGWHATFLVIGVFGALVVVSLLMFLEETSKPDSQALKLGALAYNMIDICKSRRFLVYTLAAVGPFAGLLAILTGLSPVLIGYLGVSPTAFGYLFGLIMTGNLIASLLAGKLAEALGINRLIVIVGIFCAVSGIVILAVTRAGFVSPASIAIPASGFMVGFALLLPGATAGAMSPFRERAGRASSLMGLIQLAAAAGVSLLMGAFDDGTEKPMVLVLALSGIFTIASCALLPRDVEEADARPAE